MLLIEKFVNLILDSFDWLVHVLCHVLEENGVMQKRKVGEVLKLLASGKQIKVVLEGLSELFAEDWESRKVDKKVANVSVIEQFQNELATVL